MIARLAVEVENLTKIYRSTDGKAGGDERSTGLLLDSFAPGWTRRVTAADDLAQMLAAAAKIEPAADAAASASGYRGAELRATRRSAMPCSRCASRSSNGGLSMVQY